MPEDQLSKHSEFEIREVVEADLDQIMMIEDASFTLPWTRRSYLEMMCIENVRFELIMIEGLIVGYMLYQYWQNGAELHTIAVDEKRRRTGVGSKLISHLITWARSNNISKIYLQVRPSNSKALSLYHKFGFKGIAKRKHYYTDNGEDAIIMEAVV